MVRSAAGISFGWNENGPFESHAVPPIIGTHGINGIIIAGGALLGRNVAILP